VSDRATDFSENYALDRFTVCGLNRTCTHNGDGCAAAPGLSTWQDLQGHPSPEALWNLKSKQL
jgi:hypothetical protein